MSDIIKAPRMRISTDLDTAQNIAHHTFCKMLRGRHEHVWWKFTEFGDWMQLPDSAPIRVIRMVYQCRSCGMWCVDTYRFECYHGVIVAPGGKILEEHLFERPPMDTGRIT